jgi:FeS assembly protein SufD
MNAVTTALESYQRLIENQRDRLPGAQLSWLKTQRDLAEQRFIKSGFPTRKSEAWRYTNIDSLLKKNFVPGTTGNDDIAKRAYADVLTETQSQRIVFINGRYSQSLSTLKELPKGVYIAGLQQAMAERADVIEKILAKSPTDEFHVFNDLNTALFHDGMVCYVEENIQSPDAYHISTLFVHQEARSQYQGNTIVLGGAWSRTDYNVNFQGEQARNQLDGLYLVKDKQLADIHLSIHHAVPHCSSEQDFRGILLGSGRGVFDGLINVAEQAQKTEAHLHNANLMLSRSAEVDTKPQLLIYADDVKCSHGTTVGELDPEQLFYLRSRGISEAEAKKMLCIGFAQAVLEKCTVESLRTKAENALNESLLNVAVTTI